MTKDPALLSAQNSVLQKVGRNVVNFQTMERMLKRILKVASLADPQPASRVAAHVQKQESWLHARSMGELVTHMAETLRSEPLEPPADIKECWVSFSLKIEGENWGPTEWQQDMRRVVEERNYLVHHILESFNIETIDGCTALEAALDAQREKILPAFNQLHSMLSGINMHGQVLGQNIDAIVEASTKQRSPHDA